ncbi:FadR/GntR family transcriptional regulator [Taklimakanibacter deserti]|uniref:FadR/GntR family transcriptional regulator n=1 Tax=Taklimakanibacter deserti TaxID=2267839 RepID=UPI000E65BB4C
MVDGTIGRDSARPKPGLRSADTSLGGKIASTLAVRILAGTYIPGTPLPSEEKLCKEFKASRTALRESMRVLTAKGLVEPRQRVGTIVRSDEEWNRLDPDVLGWMRQVAPDPEFIRGLIEVRTVIEPVAAELAARRATARDLAAIESAYDRMCKSHPHDLETCTAADLDFHLGILAATKNPVFAHLGSVIGAALSSSFRLTTSLTRSYERTLAAHGEVLEAIRLRKPKAAREAMLGLIDVASNDLEGLDRDTYNYSFTGPSTKRQSAK